MAKVILKFRVPSGPYQSGEIAGFDPAEAQRYLDAGAAVRHDAEAKPAPEKRTVRKKRARRKSGRKAGAK